MYGQQLSWFQRLMQRFHPSPEQMAEAELKEARLAELQSKSEAEYAALRMQMHNLTAEYHAGRICRLECFLGVNSNDTSYIKGFGLTNMGDYIIDRNVPLGPLVKKP